MSKRTTPFVLLALLAAAGACSESKPSTRLRGAWTELQLPGAEHASIEGQPNERNPGFRVVYRGHRAYDRLCQEYVAALEPLGFQKIGETRGSENPWISIDLAKGEQVWDLNCQYFDDAYTEVMTTLRSSEDAAAIRARAAAPGA